MRVRQGEVKRDIGLSNEKCRFREAQRERERVTEVERDFGLSIREA